MTGPTPYWILLLIGLPALSSCNCNDSRVTDAVKKKEDLSYLEKAEIRREEEEIRSFRYLREIKEELQGDWISEDSELRIKITSDLVEINGTGTWERFDGRKELFGISPGFIINNAYFLFDFSVIHEGRDVVRLNIEEPAGAGIFSETYLVRPGPDIRGRIEAVEQKFEDEDGEVFRYRRHPYVPPEPSKTLQHNP